MLRATHLVLTLSALLAAPAAAQLEAYTMDTSDILALVDLETGTRTDIAQFPEIGLAEGLAITDDESTLYLTNSAGVLYTIDLASLTIINSANVGLGNLEALDFANGRLLAVTFGSNPSLIEIDPASGIPTIIGSLGISIPGSARSLSIASPTVAYTNDPNSLYRIDLNTGAATIVGGLAIDSTMFGTDFFNGRLYGITSTEGQIHEIDLDTGLATPTGAPNFPSAFYLGLAAIPSLDVQFISGELTPASTAFDRPRGSGFQPAPCVDPVLDSYNNNQPYDRFTISAIDSSQPVVMEMRTLEPALVDFDPYLAFYCSFSPANPLETAFLLDDDSGFDGDDATRQNARMEIGFGEGSVGTLIATSYASWAPTRYGAYELVITNGIATPFCAPDVNGDGIVDNGDISAFVQLFLAQDPAADFNGDGFVDNGDIGAFVQAFLAGC